MVAASYLPDDCWQRVFKFLDEDNDHSHCNGILKSLSVVSKEFLSITSRFRYSLIMGYSAPSNLRPEFERFTNLTSIDLQGYPHNLNNILRQLSCFPLLYLRSLNLSYHKIIPTIGLLAFSKKITTLTSLVCSGIGSIDISDMFLIVYSFPFLEELDLSYPRKIKINRKCTNIETFSLALLCKLRKVNLSGHFYMNNNLIFQLFKNCMFLEETIVFDCDQITIVGIASALRERPKLRSLSFSCMFEWKQYATLFARIVEFTVGFTYMMETKKSVERKQKKSVDFVLNPQLKSLHLECNKRCLTVENGFGEGICQILRRCRKIRHLNLAYCSNLRGMNFKLPKLEVMNLSHAEVNDKALSLISKSCCGLLQLILECCHHVTERGVNHVMKNCTQLQEINLRGCCNVHPNVIALMVISRPSLRKIIVPPCCYFSDQERERYLPSFLTLLY